MKKPTNIEKLSLHDLEFALGPYPPLGFAPVGEAELGNGDYYGLYWPIGREHLEPVVCDMLHDEWSLELSFSSTDKFIEYLELNDWERGDEEIQDESFAPNYFHNAKLSLSKNNIEEAIDYLKLAVESFPENSEYWFSLASQLRRVEKYEESVLAAINAFAGNWVFAFPPDGVLRLLQNNNANEIIPNDPLVKRANDLNMNYGDSKENNNYILLKECIDEYFDLNDNLKALSLYQNYAYMMYAETTSFQERYGFSLSQWQSEFSELCQDKLGDNRKLES